MAQLHIGALRDFEASERKVYLVQRTGFCHIRDHCEKEYMVFDVPTDALYADENNNLVCDFEVATEYHYDGFVEAQEKYLALADQYGAVLKVREWSPKSWKQD